MGKNEFFAERLKCRAELQNYENIVDLMNEVEMLGEALNRTNNPYRGFKTSKESIQSKSATLRVTSFI